MQNADLSILNLRVLALNREVSFFRSVGKVAVGAFCVWHMCAIAIYCLPAEAHDRITEYLRVQGQPIVSPYLFWTSQWQQWNLFSPDPLRRVTDYVIQTKENGDWHDLMTLNADTLSWASRTREMKMLFNLEAGGASTAPVREAYLQIACEQYGIPVGTPLRFVFQTYVIPFTLTQVTLQDWQDYKPVKERTPDVEIVCTSSHP